MSQGGRLTVVSLQCTSCGSAMAPEPFGPFRLGIPHLRNLQQVTVMVKCTGCGKQRFQLNVAPGQPGFSALVWETSPLPSNGRSYRSGHMSVGRVPGDVRTSLSFNFACSSGSGTAWPLSDATVQDGTVIDQYGDPDRMVEFAEEYLKQHWKLMRSGELPRSLTELMPALLLLVTAAELVLKAFGVRSEVPQSRSHSLVGLYQGIRVDLHADIEGRFARTAGVAALTALGAPTPSVESVLGTYADIYGGGRGVHTEARYYAEPTSMLPKESDLQNANLVKGNTPYPVFMPYLVEVLIQSYRYSSGLQRLTRRGGVIRERTRDSTSRGHGEWQLQPSSLGLAAVEIGQQVALDESHNERVEYRRFTATHPRFHLMDWMYGGSKILYYAAAKTQRRDGADVIGGIECHFTVDDFIGIHTRDLDKLADLLDQVDAGTAALGPLP